MKRLAAAAILATVIATPALAEDFYVLGSLGRSSVDIDQSAIDADLTDVGVTNLSSSLDKHDTGYKLQLGYRFNRYFAVEGG
jgi:OOP family OmpA-OmpF porin